MVPWSKSIKMFPKSTRPTKLGSHCEQMEFTSQRGVVFEYNLPISLKVREVVITSKVDLDKTWTGKISYVANYPTDAGQAGANAAGGTQGKWRSLAPIHRNYQ